MQSRKVRTMDYAKNRTTFAEEYERQRNLLILELQRVTEGKGLFSRLIHAIARKPFLRFN